MTVADMRWWDWPKLIILFIKYRKSDFEPEKALGSLMEHDIKGVLISRRGGIEVSIDEIKNSEEFQDMIQYAKTYVEQDLAQLENGARKH